MPLCQNMKREMKRKIQAVTKWAKYVWVFLNFVVLFFYLLCFPRRGFLTNLDTKKSFISWNRQDGLASSRMLQGLGWQSDQNRVVFHLKATVMTVSFRKAETPPPPNLLSSCPFFFTNEHKHRLLTEFFQEAFNYFCMSNLADSAKKPSWGHLFEQNGTRSFASLSRCRPKYSLRFNE